MIRLIICLLSIVLIFTAEGSNWRPGNRSQIVREQRHTLVGHKVLCSNPNSKYITSSSCNMKLKSRFKQVLSFELTLLPNVTIPWLHVSVLEYNGNRSILSHNYIADTNKDVLQIPNIVPEETH